MFGYIKVHSPQLRVWEKELYENVYCGLCKHGGKRTTRLSRFLLSYDFVSLAVARMALLGDEIKIEKSFCPYFPKKKNIIASNSSIEYSSDAFIILIYYKLLDDKNDSKGIKRFFSLFPPYLVLREAKKAEERQPHLSEVIKSEIENLSLKEKENCSSIDSVADCFASLLAEILKYEIEGENKRIAHEIGYHIGRYIYIIDALDDFEKDVEKGNYNPLVNIYSNVDNLKESLNDIVITLKASMNRVHSAVELIDNDNFTGILENLSTYGSESVINDVIKKFKE